MSSIENNLRFPGQYADAETGLYYNYFRYYDPRVGRFLRADPIGLAGGIHIFLYVRNNPVTFIDPKGFVDAGVMKIVIPIIIAIPDLSDAVVASIVIPTGIGYVLSKLPKDDSADLPPVIPVPAPTPGPILLPPGGPVVSVPPMPIPIPVPVPGPMPGQCDMTSYPPNRMPPSTPPGPRDIPATSTPYIPTRIMPITPTPPPPDPCDLWEGSLKDRYKRIRSKRELAAWWLEYGLYAFVCGPFNVSDPQVPKK